MASALRPCCALLFAVSCFAAPAREARCGELPALDQWHFTSPIDTLGIASIQDLRLLFAAKDYRLEALRTGEAIPRIYLLHLVDGFGDVRPIDTRESLFIRTVLPLVARANAEIRAQRRLLETIIAAQGQGIDTPPDQADWLAALAQLYRGDPENLSALRIRVDEIPPSLALAQAIDESGWGAAPLALESNDLFGEHAPAELGRGNVPVPGRKVSVAAFPSLLDGVLAYMTNINRHPAYAKLRALRAQHRRDGRRLDGYTLAAGLVDYSARGMEYVDMLRRLMREHKLHLYDAARLDTDGGTILVHAGR